MNIWYECVDTLADIFVLRKTLHVLQKIVFETKVIDKIAMQEQKIF